MSIFEIIGWTTTCYLSIGFIISVYYVIFKTRKFTGWQDCVIASVMMTINWFPVIVSEWLQ